VVEEKISVEKNELENIMQYKRKGAIVRSKAMWYNKGGEIANIS